MRRSAVAGKLSIPAAASAFSLLLFSLSGCGLMEKSETARWEAYRETVQMEVMAKSLAIKERERTKQQWIRSQAEVLSRPSADSSSAAAIMMATQVVGMFSPEAQAVEGFLKTKTAMPTGVLKETMQEFRGMAKDLAPAALVGATVGRSLNTVDKAVDKALSREPASTVISDSTITQGGAEASSEVDKSTEVYEENGGENGEGPVGPLEPPEEGD
jgi:hypothetical protein